MITKSDFKNIKCLEISLKNAMRFAERLKERDLYFEPSPEVHPDNQIALTWRNKKGIINIAFDERNLATWAAYFSNQEITRKGHFEIEENSERTANFCDCLKFLHSKSNKWPVPRVSTF